jgi:hypothetical protein
MQTSIIRGPVLSHGASGTLFSYHHHALRIALGDSPSIPGPPGQVELTCWKAKYLVWGHDRLAGVASLQQGSTGIAEAGATGSAPTVLSTEVQGSNQRMP